MKHTLLATTAMISMAILSACHNRVIHNRADEYQKASSIAPMTVPAPYTSTSMTPHYPVKDAPLPDAKPVDLTPPRVLPHTAPSQSSEN